MKHHPSHRLAAIILSAALLLWLPSKAQLTIAESPTVPQKPVQVLNLGAFHMGNSSDANTTAFDENDPDNQRQVHKIAEKLAAFKPTVIAVEVPPEKNEQLQASYQAYLDNPEMNFENPSEVELLAFEVGRLSGAERIYGIDHKLAYNYRIGQEIDNQIDPELYKEFFANPAAFYPELAGFDQEGLSLLERLRRMNMNRFLDFLIAVNADMLTHAGTEGHFEGADEAAKYYQRNLRMYANLNRLDLEEGERVFLLMGASHTAFFRDFMSRSPKYQMVSVFKYLQGE